MRRWSSPLSPMAMRAALMRLENVEFGYDAPAPDSVEEALLRHDMVAIGDKVGQDVEDLRLDGDRPIRLAQFAPVRVEREVFEFVAHGFPAQRPSVGTLHCWRAGAKSHAYQANLKAASKSCSVRRGSIVTVEIDGEADVSPD